MRIARGDVRAAALTLQCSGRSLYRELRELGLVDEVREIRREVGWQPAAGLPLGRDLRPREGPQTEPQPGSQVHSGSHPGEPPAPGD